MLLEFMHALEKNMYCTYAGSCLRSGASGTAVAFYKSNRKVGLSWKDSIIQENNTVCI